MKNLPLPVKVLLVFVLMSGTLIGICYLSDLPIFEAEEYFENDLLLHQEVGNVGLRTWWTQDVPEGYELNLTLKGRLVMVALLLVMPLLLAWRVNTPGRFGKR